MVLQPILSPAISLSCRRIISRRPTFRQTLAR